MNYFFSFFFLFLLIGTLKAELTLKISKTVNGKVTPVTNGQVYAAFDMSLALTCKLVSTGDTANYIDDELSWGWKRKNVQFTSVADLEKLVQDNMEPLRQFVNKSDHYNKAVKNFNFVQSVDAGTYACMSLKYNLFQIVTLHVRTDSMDNLKKTLNILHLNDSTVVFPKSDCTLDMFVCNSGTTCVRKENVCDNVPDCDDYSDESKYLCGINRCQDLNWCGNRCISESACCGEDAINECNGKVLSACCKEIVEKRPSYVNNADLDFNWQLMEQMADATPASIKEALDPSFNKIFNPSMKTVFDSHDLDDLFAEARAFNGSPGELDAWTDKFEKERQDIEDIITPYKRHIRKRVDWEVFSYSVLAFIVFWSVIISTLVLCKHIVKRRNAHRTRDTLLNIARITILVPRSARSANSTAVSEPNPNKDLPPSYDDAVVNVPQNAPLL